MAHTHSVYNEDMHFIIDPVTREISNNSNKVILMQNDHNSECFTFELPQTVEGHDMTLCNKVEVHYINIDSATKSQQTGICAASDITVEDGKVICNWLISQNATKYAGVLNFVVRFACIAEDGTIEYQWFTNIHKGITVAESIYNSGDIVEEYVDILAQWEKRITNLEGINRFESRSKIYGVTFDNNKPKTTGTRIADAEGLNTDYVVAQIFQNAGHNDFDNIFPWSDIRRCNLTVDSNGKKTVIYEGERGFATEPIVCNNLFNPENVIYANIDGKSKAIVSASTCRTGYVKCEPNTTYTIIRNGTLGARFMCGCLAQFPEAGMVVSNYKSCDWLSTFEYTTDETAQYLVFYFYIAKYDTDIDPDECAKNIMIAKGTATEFEAFFEAPAVNVMVEIPKFYTFREKINGVETWAITGEPKSGFNIEPAFVDSNGKELDYIYVGAYEFSGGASTTNHSVSGRQVAVALTMANYRNIAKAINMTCIDYAIIHALQFLWVVEFADRDTDKYMQGVSHLPWFSSSNSPITAITDDRLTVTVDYSGARTKNLRVGQDVLLCQNSTSIQSNQKIVAIIVSADETTADITFDVAVTSTIEDITTGNYYIAGKAQNTGKSDTLSYHTGRISNDNALSPFRYRYIENLWGNTWAMLDGLRIKELDYYYTYDTGKYADSTVENWNKSGFKAPNQPYLGDDGHNRAWISEMGFDINNRQIVLPTACSADGTTDAYYSSALYTHYDVDKYGNALDTTQEYICVYGGGYDHNTLCGLFTMRFWWYVGGGEQQSLHSSRIVYRG